MRILVLGSRGMLGQDVVRCARSSGHFVIEASRRIENTADIYCDFFDYASIDKCILDAKADWVINCAAYTAVDAAEADTVSAYKVNALSVGVLADLCREHFSKLLHISTDYVFGADPKLSGYPDSNSLASAVQNGELKPYQPYEPTSPLGVYGKSKDLGDKLALAVNPEMLLVRVSWLHGLGGNNFIDTMLRLGRDRSEISVVNDQWGATTYTPWLAESLIKAVESNVTGIHHACSSGIVRWCDVARLVFETAKMKVVVNEITSSELGRPAPRPAYSALDSTSFSQSLGINIPTWDVGVISHVQERLVQSKK